MPGYPVGEEDPSPKKKTGSARTSKKSKRRNVIHYLDWSGEQEPVDSSPVKVREQQALVLEIGDEASPEFARDAMVAVPSSASLGSSPYLDYQTRDAPSENCTAAPGVVPLPDDQDEDACTPEPHPPMTSEDGRGNVEFQRAQEGQKADDWPSENMRPNAQSLRYGGYPAQPAPQNRNTPLVSGRLQNTSKLGAVNFYLLALYNGKLTLFGTSGNGTNWGFGAAVNGAPGLPNVQPSQTGAGASSFAQRVGGSQPAAPLDLS